MKNPYDLLMIGYSDNLQMRTLLYRSEIYATVVYPQSLTTRLRKNTTHHDTKGDCRKMD